MSRVLVIAKGSLGDMIPMYAVASGLRDRGHRVLVGTQSRHLASAAALGLEAVAIDGRAASAARRVPWISNEALGGSRAAFDAELSALTPQARAADVVLGNQLALSGPLVAADQGRPWIYCAVSPLGLASGDNPCLVPLLQRLQRRFPNSAPVDVGSRALVRTYAWLFSGVVRQAQSRLGLKHLGHPRFEGLFSRELNLVLTSPRLFERPPSFPTHTLVTGFTWLEPRFLDDSGAMRRALDFACSGEPPLLFALGGSARSKPGRFFQESLDASRRLGMRAMVVAAKRFHASIPSSPEVHATTYLPYSSVFPRVRAVMHSGGIGTIGWAARHGRPSLLVPGADDQFDNSYRAEQVGWARVWPRHRYRGPAVTAALDELLADASLSARLSEVSSALSQEDGATVACDAIEALLRG
ncbi:glycosyltransferase [Thiorhodococcus minor]|uniref:Glycosyltransferase family 1 protein n=1 Tax=Thiorhodococcus minor TaxID=57489 RepID=A0A6M0K9Q8_9GAMM|nr:glycosyltransferase [Thiorhodococcus minor]NEV65295.1 glycosyltransferase family 1 protein [Thiorhodococcus minor]